MDKLTMIEFDNNNGSLYKVSICGDGGVGKTSIINSYLGQGFQTNYKVTIGCQIATYEQLIADKMIKFQFWDLAGQQRFEFVRSAFYRGSHGAILVFDRTRRSSLHNLQKWVTEILSNLDHEVPFIILGNKSDLTEKIQVDDQEIVEIISKISQQTQNSEIPYFLTSAQSGVNLKEALTSIGQKLRKLSPQPIYQTIFRKQTVGDAY